MVQGIQEDALKDNNDRVHDGPNQLGFLVLPIQRLIDHNPILIDNLFSVANNKEQESEEPDLKHQNDSVQAPVPHGLIPPEEKHPHYMETNLDVENVHELWILGVRRGVFSGEPHPTKYI